VLVLHSNFAVFCKPWPMLMFAGFLVNLGVENLPCRASWSQILGSF
jgi:hypothetical protein